ncbi:MAG: sulfatase-like hydrolase/transferase [Cellulosilyticaceae bacterium]
MKKNILVILADQHRQDCLGAYGNQEVRTPVLDGLASEGHLYTNHYTTYPVCTPARYSMLTGLYTHQHLGWSNHCTLSETLDTFPKALRRAGYRTTAVGKMHFAPTYLDVGFDRMILSEQDGDGRFEDDYHTYLKERGLVDANDLIDQRSEYRAKADDTYWDTYGAMTSNLPEEHHSTTWITERALDEIEQWQEEGNLLMVGYIKPHHPFDPPAPYDTMYDPEQISLLPGYTEEVSEVDYYHSSGYFNHKGLTPERLKNITAKYYGLITQIDDNIGRIIEKLKEKGLYEDTTIVYTSDHGDYLGYHHMLLKANYMYDPLAKIPLIIKYARGEEGGVVNHNMSSNIDVARTILESSMAGMQHQIRGLNLQDQTQDRGKVICEGLRVDHHSPGQEIYYEYMVRSHKFKLITHKNLNTYRAFDLEKDPFELCDVAGDEAYQEVIKEHMDFLMQTLVFDAQTPIYLNYNEPVISPDKKVNQENVAEMRNYFWDQTIGE